MTHKPPATSRFGIVFVLLLAIAGAGAWFVLFPRPGRHESATIIVHRGATMRAVADSLKQHRVIVSRRALLAWMRLTRAGFKLQPGKYVFYSGQGVVGAAYALTTTVQRIVMVTIPEGLTIEQTASRIAGAISFDSAAFVALCNDSSFVRTVAPVPAATLEGLLFPDTYDFRDVIAPDDVARRMVGRFEIKWAELEASLKPDAAEPGSNAGFSWTPLKGGCRLSELQIVTLASIVEKEAALSEERPHIAGVFCHRLKRKMPLGADPTVRYIFRKFSGQLCKNELNWPSPYNTRRYAGLPPGPICSPGIAPLRAALFPLKTDDLFFVAKWDGSGAHDFSTTYEEHNRKKARIHRVNLLRIRQKTAASGN